MSGTLAERAEVTDYCPCGKRWVAHHNADGTVDIAVKAGVVFQAPLPAGPADIELISAEGGIRAISVPGTGTCNYLICRLLGRTGKEHSR